MVWLSWRGCNWWLSWVLLHLHRWPSSRRHSDWGHRIAFVADANGLHLLVQVVLRNVLLIQTFIRWQCLLNTTLVITLVWLCFVERVLTVISLSLKDRSCSRWYWLRRPLAHIVCRCNYIGVVLNVVDIYAVNTIVEVSDIQGQVVIVDQLNIVYLFVDILIPTLTVLHSWWDLRANLWSSFSFQSIIWNVSSSTRGLTAELVMSWIIVSIHLSSLFNINNIIETLKN